MAALRVDRVTAPYAIDGAMDGLAFRARVEQVLVPTLEKRVIVFLDNVCTTRLPALSRAALCSALLAIP